MASRKRLRWLRFYGLWLKEAAPPSLNLADWLVAAVGVLAPLFIWFIKARTSNLDTELEALLTDLQWMIPAVAFGGIFVFRMVAAPYHLYRAIADERDRLIIEDDEIAVELSRFYNEGGRLQTEHIEKDGLEDWKERAQVWETKVIEYVQRNLGAVDARLFALIYYQGSRFEHAADEEHQAELGFLYARLQHIHQMIERRR